MDPGLGLGKGRKSRIDMPCSHELQGVAGTGGPKVPVGVAVGVAVLLAPGTVVSVAVGEGVPVGELVADGNGLGSSVAVWVRVGCGEAVSVLL